jgi:hypothetical protein
MADEPQKTEIVGAVKVEAADPSASPLGTPPPKVEKHTQTTETVTTTGPPVQPAPPQIIADDNARKYLAVAVILQFLVVVGFIIYTGKGAPASNTELMILGAEVTFVTTVLNYYFGSSSGSTAKSAAVGDRR